MAHFPVDHPLRSFYRGLAFLVGIGLIVFGIVAYSQTSGMDFFDQEGERVLGLTANPAFALLSIVAGALIVIVIIIGRNLDVPVNIGFGWVFLLAGLSMLCLLRTDANFLAFSIANVNVSFVIGLILFAAGMYSTVSRS